MESVAMNYNQFIRAIKQLSFHNATFYQTVIFVIDELFNLIATNISQGFDITCLPIWHSFKQFFSQMD